MILNNKSDLLQSVEFQCLQAGTSVGSYQNPCVHNELTQTKFSQEKGLTKNSISQNP